MKALFCILIALAMTGCSMLSKPENQPAARLAVQYATLKAIEQGDDHKARAERIKSIAIDVQTLFKSDEQATIPALDQLIHERLPDTLSPADKLLADNLILVITQELQSRVGTGVLTPEQMLVATEVLQWVIDATVYGGAT
jgi:hypothetical protein